MTIRTIAVGAAMLALVGPGAQAQVRATAPVAKPSGTITVPGGVAASVVKGRISIAPTTVYIMTMSQAGSTGDGLVSYIGYCGTEGHKPLMTACVANISYGKTMTFTAKADPGSTFAGWSGACTGKGACTITGAGGKLNLYAKFTSNTAPPAAAPAPANVTLSVATGGDSGAVTPWSAQLHVTSAPQGIKCGPIVSFPTCTMPVTKNQTVFLTVTYPDDGEVWSTEWVGCTPAGSGKACQIKMDADKAVAVIFTHK